MNYRVINTLRFERSDLDRVIIKRPNDAGGYDSVTVRDELDNPDRWLFRADILMVNVQRTHCPTCTCSDGKWDQYTVEVRQDGSLRLNGPDSAWDLFPESDLEWARQEAARMVAVAAEHPRYAGAYLR